MDFYDWQKSDAHDAKEFRERIEAGEEGNDKNPLIAAERAYYAGIEEGKRLAAIKLVNFIKGA